MGAALNHVAVVHDENHVGVADGGEAVRDDEARAPHGQRIHGLLDEFFGAGVDGGGGFVEDEDRSVLHHGAGDGEQLALSLGE